MNTRTGEVRDLNQLTPEDLSSGEWVPIEEIPDHQLPAYEPMHEPLVKHLAGQPIDEREAYLRGRYVVPGHIEKARDQVRMAQLSRAGRGGR